MSEVDIVNSKRLVHLLCVALCAAAAPCLAAQDSVQHSGIDRDVVAMIGHSVEDLIAPASLHPADTGTRHPWSIALPATDTALWNEYQRDFLRRVHGRLFNKTDTLVDGVSIGPVTIDGNMQLAKFTIGFFKRCAKHETGGGTMYALSAMRQGATWMTPPKVSAYAFGDPMIIKTRKPPRPCHP